MPEIGIVTFFEAVFIPLLPLPYGSIVSYWRTHCKPTVGLTVTTGPLNTVTWTYILLPCVAVGGLFALSGVVAKLTKDYFSSKAGSKK